MPMLSHRQALVLALYGAALWFLAAMLVRTITPMGAFEGNTLLISYALVIPGTVPAIWIAGKIATLAQGQMPIAILIVTATALLLDGLAFGLFPALYGSDPELVIKGAAAILWGAGVGLVLGYLMDRSAPIA